MKRTNLVLLILSTLFAFLLVEGGYRFLLSRKLVWEAEAKTKSDPAPTFTFYAYPAPWRFDEKQGFVFNENRWLGGSIVKGAFSGCGSGGPGNKYGNVFDVRSDYKNAALKVLLLGASFTMVTNKDGMAMSDLLEKALSGRLGKPVSILNFSRDSTGLLTSFDIARAKIPELKPDLLLFVFNSTQFRYQRHWRVVHPDPYRPKMWRMAFSLDPNEKLNDRRRVILQPNVISSEVDQAWCDKLTTAKKAGEQDALRNDPLVRKLIASNQQISKELQMPFFAINFYAPNISFVYNRLVHQHPYHGMNVYEENTAYAPISIEDFGTDKQFVGAVEFVKSSGIPFLMIHIPLLGEMGKQVYDFGTYAVPPKQGQLLADSLERLTGKPIFHLYSYYSPAAKKRDPLALVHGKDDLHPNSDGTEVMAEAIERLLLETNFVDRK